MLFDVFFATEESGLWEEKRGYLYAIAELRSGLKKKSLFSHLPWNRIEGNKCSKMN